MTSAIEEALAKPNGARFWKCALQVNPASYLADYQGQEHGLDRDTYNRAMVESCRAHGIEVVGLADHGSVAEIDALRDALRAGGITVFPGFEIASTEKVHMVCLFDPDTSKDDLLLVLGRLGLQPGNSGVMPSELGCLAIAEKVLQAGGVWYAAHMTGKNGLLRLSGAGDNLVHVWRNADLVLAGQIPGPIGDLAPAEELENATDKRVTHRKYADIVRNRNPDYSRERPLAILNAKDVKTPRDLANTSATCFIKMTTPSIGAVKQAFMDPSSRIVLRTDDDASARTRITAVAWEGGYLDGMRIHFSEGLNTIIGGRGTGKSTIIESIRYALGLLPKGADAQKTHDEVIKVRIPGDLGKRTGAPGQADRAPGHGSEATNMRGVG